MNVTMTLDRTAQDITKELKKKMRVLDRGSFNAAGSRASVSRGQRSSMTAQMDMNSGRGRRTIVH